MLEVPVRTKKCRYSKGSNIEVHTGPLQALDSVLVHTGYLGTGAILVPGFGTQRYWLCTCSKIYFRLSQAKKHKKKKKCTQI